MSQLTLKLTAVFAVLTPLLSQAETLYLVGDHPVRRSPSTLEATMEPFSVIERAFQDAVESESEFYETVKSLIFFKETQASGGYEPYNRKKHFGSWVVTDPDKKCFNTRALILAQTSEVEPEFASNGCTVRRGRWYDPYSDRVYTEASQLEIDHVVPLKNAYISGAYAWDQQKRCIYSNYVGNAFHLMAVESTENRRKSDRTPEKYIPPNRNFTCDYVKNWLKIKLYWRLTLTLGEKAEVEKILSENRCKLDDLTYSDQELAEQQAQMRAGIKACL